MSNDANINRITFEEIQEFKGLNLFDIVSSDPNKVILLTYDPPTRVFSVAELDLNNGLVSIIRQDTLTTDVIINNDAMSVERGYIFYKDQTMTEIMQQLATPKFNARLTVKATNTISTIESDDVLLVESATPTQLDLDNDYDQRDAGALDGAVSYFLNSAPISDPYVITLNNYDTAELKVEGTTLANANFDATNLSDTMTIKATYPVFYGFSMVDVLPGDFSSGTLLLKDAAADGKVLLPIAGEPSPTYNWFAVHNSITPINWVGVYSNGTYQYSNEGLVSETFNNKGTITYKGAIYTVYMTKDSTLFEQDLMINF